MSLCLGGKFSIRVLGCLAAVGAALCFVAGCVGAGRVVPASSFPQLQPNVTLELGSSAVGICEDGDGLLALENSGTRIVRYVVGLTVLDTLPLTHRVIASVGVAADRFYIYVYDADTLYRMSKDRLDLQPWLRGVRVAGLAAFEDGIMLVSDADRGEIWYKGLFNESRMFISGAEVARPGAMVAIEDGSFAVLSTASRLLYFFNRSGVVTGSIPLPASCDLLAYDGHGTFYIGLRGKPQVWVLRGNRLIGYRLPGSVSPLSLATVHNRLVVLDAGTRLGIYDLPRQ